MSMRFRQVTDIEKAVDKVNTVELIGEEEVAHIVIVLAF